MTRFQASQDELYNMLAFLTKPLQIPALEGKLSMKLEMACEEALVNIIHYAYDPSVKAEDRYICLSCEVNEHKILIDIKDAGMPFNPLKDSPKKLELQTEAENREIGGLGIYFMQQVMDKVTYERVGGENILRFVKDLK